MFGFFIQIYIFICLHIKIKEGIQWIRTEGSDGMGAKGSLGMYKLRYQQRKSVWGQQKVQWLGKVAVVVLVLLLFCWQPFRMQVGKGMEAMGTSLGQLVLRCCDGNASVLLYAAMPIIDKKDKSEELPALTSLHSLLTAVKGTFMVSLHTPREVLADEIALLRDFQPASGLSGENAAEKKAKEEQAVMTSTPQLTKEVLVGIYHTHTGETYALTDGQDRIEGGIGGVVKVGEALQKELEDTYGIRTVHSTHINDKSYNASYTESEKDARRLLEENPQIQVLLDIHRDAGKSRENSLVVIDGQELAPIMFVVGSDARAPFPNWEKNHQFAQKLADLMEKQYPGLCCGVKVKEGRYNQFLHPQAMLVEVGSVSNATVEGERSARILASLVAEVLKEEGFIEGKP